MVRSGPVLFFAALILSPPFLFLFTDLPRFRSTSCPYSSRFKEANKRISLTDLSVFTRGDSSDGIRWRKKKKEIEKLQCNVPYSLYDESGAIHICAKNCEISLFRLKQRDLISLSIKCIQFLFETYLSPRET